MPPAFDTASSGMPRSFLRPILLLLLAETPSHGYDLLEQTIELGLERTDPGGLYRTLRAMEQEGLVCSWWEGSSAGPARRTYALSPEGLDWLHASAGALRETVRYLRDASTATNSWAVTPRSSPTVRRAQIVLGVDADAARDRLAGRLGTLTPVDGTTCRLDADVDHLDWFALHLTLLDVEFTVVDPPQLRDRLIDIAERFTRASVP